MYESQLFVPKFLKKTVQAAAAAFLLASTASFGTQGSSSLFAHRQGLSETPPPKIACPLSSCCFYFEAALILWHHSHSTTLGVHHLASSLLLDTSLLYATIQGQNPARACSTLASPCALGTRPAAPLSKVLL